MLYFYKFLTFKKKKILFDIFYLKFIRFQVFRFICFFSFIIKIVDTAKMLKNVIINRFPGIVGSLYRSRSPPPPPDEAGGIAIVVIFTEAVAKII